MGKYTEAIGFSKLDTYRSCPAKFKFQYINKLPQPGNAAMQRGSQIHDTCEAYLRGWIYELPDFLTAWQERFDNLRTLKCKTEESWGFNRNWELLENWFQPETWLRAKSDAHYIDGDTLVVIDFKTGKYRIPSTEQVELYAICASAIYPEVPQVKTAFWFLDTGEIYEQAYTKEHLVALREKYVAYFNQLLNEEIWKPMPSRECKWCHYSCSKKGPCEF